MKKFSHIHYDMASLPYKIHEWFSMYSNIAMHRRW